MVTFGLLLSAIATGALILAAIIMIVYIVSLFVDNLSELAGLLAVALFLGLICYLLGGIILDQLGWIDGSKIGIY